MKQTAFIDIHKKLGAKLVDFAGFEMPVQYEGIVKEHMAVRESVGVFDVSHMGEVEVHGNDALAFVQKITTNDVSKLSPGDVQYSAMCYENAGIVDDLLVYNMGNYFMLVINASNIDKDMAWMEKNITGDVELRNISDETSLLAVQGRNSLNVVQKICDVDLSDVKYYTFIKGKVAGIDAVISRTGYTGEEFGFELYFTSDQESSEKVWNALFTAGEEYGIKPVGLGARDTLRLEYAYRLYGNDMDENCNTLEAGLGWITKLDKAEFNGREELLKIKEQGLKRKLVGFEIEDRVPARHGYEIYADDEKIGSVTSGSPSPVLNKNIGLAYVKTGYSKIGSEIQIDIRGRKISAKIVKTPFIN